MPLYEYYCEQCGKCFESLRPISKADATIQCPNCFNIQVKRKLSKISSFATNGSSNKPSTNCTGCTSQNCSNCH